MKRLLFAFCVVFSVIDLFGQNGPVITAVVNGTSFGEHTNLDRR